jgi:hypothetical protein
MAVVKTILKKTHNEVVIKVAGTAGSETISLATDLLHTNQALDGVTQSANIVNASWTGTAGSVISVARNSVNILNMPGDQPQQFDFEGTGFVDSVNNTSDIVVTIGTNEAQVYLVLHKVGGYATKIETAQFSVYDNRNAVGS